MFIDILNFIFVYVISGLILSAIIHSFFQKDAGKKFSLLFGYGIAPLLISLLLCYLYYFFPHRLWGFYASIIYTIFLISLCLLSAQISSYLKINLRKIATQAKIFAISCNFLSKIMLIFIFFITFISFVLGSIYPSTWADSHPYLRQGYVYSQDRSLDRLETRTLFSDFNGNKITPPSETYEMDTAIRPALPILYSFFFRKSIISETEYFSTRFIYFYYFLLSIFALYYYLRKHRFHALAGVCIFLSCYYSLAFGPLLGAKEIILLFLSFFSIMLTNEIKKATDPARYKYAIAVGLLIGLAMYINLSGIIIGGIIFLLLLKEFGISKRAIPLIFFAALSITVFSGFEIDSIPKFILNRNSLAIKNTSTTFSSGELNNYKIGTLQNKKATLNAQPDSSLKLSVMLMGKLQGITQIQFYGFIFIIFLITLFRTLKDRSLNDTSKNVMLYMILFFFIVMDPFFLNPHKDAYILSISPKYTVLLTIFAAFFIATHFDSLTKIQEKSTNKIILLLFSYFMFFSSILCLIPLARKMFVDIIFFLLSKIIPLYNDTDYYLSVLNNFTMFLAIAYIGIFLIFYALKKFNKIREISLTSMLSASIIVFLFIFPNLFTLSLNYNIRYALTHLFHPNDAGKIAATTNIPTDKQLFTIIDYINNHVRDNEKIYVAVFGDNNNVWYLTNNNQRLTADNPTHDLAAMSYLLMNRNKPCEFSIPTANHITIQTKDFVLYKIN